VSGLSFDEIDRLMGEDPDDRTIREAHGFSYEDDYRDRSLLCRNGCGETYFDIAVGKRRVCRAAMAAMIKRASVLAASLPPRRTLHYHPSVTAALAAAAPPREPEPLDFMSLGRIGDLCGIDVYENAEMMPGAWEIREGAQGGKGGGVVHFGVIGPPGGRFIRDEHGNMFADPTADGSAA
jgi:hypothetical protein